MTITYSDLQSQEGGILSPVDSPTQNDLVLHRVVSTARNIVISPKPVIPNPKYLLQHWYGYGWLSAPEVALVVGIRQAAFLPKESPRKTKETEISLRHVETWCGFSFARISTMLDKADESYLSWFFKRLTHHRRKQNSFSVRIDVPLALHHLIAIENAIQHYYNRWQKANSQQDAMSFLLYFEKQIPDEHKLMAFYQEQNGKGQRPPEYYNTVDILKKYFQRLSIEAVAFCENFEAKIIRPDDTFVISHYYAKNWLSELNSLEAITIQYLRLKVYSKKTIGQLTFATLKDFANELKIDERTARRIMNDSLNPQKPISKFLKITRDEVSRAVKVEVAMIDPIHPKDMEWYESLVEALLNGVPVDELETRPDEKEKKTGNRKRKYADAKIKSNGQAQNVNSSTANCLQPDRILLSDELQIVYRLSAKGLQANGKKLTGEPQEVNREPANSLQPDSKLLTDEPQNVDTLIKSESESFNTPFFNSQQQPLEGQVVAVVVNGWNLTKILAWGGTLSSRYAQRLLEQARGDPTTGEKFIAKWIWAYERKAVNLEGRGIQSPEWYALKRWQEPSPAVYMDIAQMHPCDFYDEYFSTNGYGGLYSNPAIRQIEKNLREKGFTSVLKELIAEYEADDEYNEPDENLGSDAPEDSADEPGGAGELVPPPSNTIPEDSGIPVSIQRAWEAAFAQLEDYSISKHLRDTLKTLRLTAYAKETGTLTFTAADAYTRDLIDSRFNSTLTRIFTGILNRSVTLVIVADNQA